jgi:hypothetical protein
VTVSPKEPWDLPPWVPRNSNPPPRGGGGNFLEHTHAPLLPGNHFPVSVSPEWEEPIRRRGRFSNPASRWEQCRPITRSLQGVGLTNSMELRPPLRSHQLLSYSRFSQHKSPSLVAILSHMNPVHTIHPISLIVLVFILVSFLPAVPPKPWTHSSSPHACYIPCSSHQSGPNAVSVMCDASVARHLQLLAAYEITVLSVHLCLWIPLIFVGRLIWSPCCLCGPCHIKEAFEIILLVRGVRRS